MAYQPSSLLEAIASEAWGIGKQLINGYFLSQAAQQGNNTNGANGPLGHPCDYNLCTVHEKLSAARAILEDGINNPNREAFARSLSVIKVNEAVSLLHNGGAPSNPRVYQLEIVAANLSLAFYNREPLATLHSKVVVLAQEVYELRYSIGQVAEGSYVG